MTALFVAGAHTDVGKTHVACAILQSARAQGLSVDALKPVVSGFEAACASDSDPGRLLAAMGESCTPDTLTRLSPWRYAAPLAPPMAARLENQVLELAPMAAWCRQRLEASSADLMLVEGVGGLMSPIAEKATGLDLMTELGLPAVLVGGSYLGAISHTLTALDVLRSRGLPAMAVVISESGGEGPSLADTAQAVRDFNPEIPLIELSRDGVVDFATRLGLA